MPSTCHHVDVNQKGTDDFIEFTVDDYVLDQIGLAFEFIDPNDPGAGMEIPSASLMLSGMQAEVTTDPPFTIASTATTPVAIPLASAVWLFGAALGALTGFSRRGRAAWSLTTHGPGKSSRQVARKRQRAKTASAGGQADLQRLPSSTQPLPTKGMRLATMVMNSTLLSSDGEATR